MKTFPTIGAFLAHMIGVRAAMAAAEHAGLEAAGRLIEQEAKDLIGTEYAGWPALADATVERKSARGQTGRISATDPEFATGEMRSQIGHSVDGHTAIIGNADPVSVYQEFGTEKMPPRPSLAPAAHRKGEEAANAIGLAVAEAIAGKPARRG